MTGGALTIREGTPQDHPFIFELGDTTLEANLSELRSAPHPSLELAYRKLLGYCFANPHVALIARHGEERVGFALLLTDLVDELTQLPQLFLAYMAVAPHARGGGVATALLEHSEMWGRAHGLPHFSLMVTNVNAAAARLYEKYGFVDERRLMCKTL